MTTPVEHDLEPERSGRGRSRRRIAAAGLVGATGLLLTGTGVYAALSATAFNASAQAVSSGTLRLTMAANGVGFSQAVANLAPGDSVSRYVALTNGGTLDGKDLSLAVADATPTKLTSDPAKGLRVAVNACSVAWTATTGACSGTTTSVLAPTALSALRAAPVALTPGTTAAGATQNLQLSLVLPDQNELVQNGALPSDSIQGLSASLTWTFSEVQRTATTTSS